MSWDLVLRHCAAIRATLDQTRVSMELQSAQLAGLEAFAKAEYARETAPTARLELPTRCTGLPEEKCALRSDEARISHATMVHPNRWMCDGCEIVSDNGLTTE
jgi:hypothetical protein